MIAIVRAFIVWLTLGSRVGCTTMRAVGDVRSNSIRGSVDVGDDVRAWTTDGLSILMRLYPAILFLENFL